MLRSCLGPFLLAVLIRKMVREDPILQSCQKDLNRFQKHAPEECSCACQDLEKLLLIETGLNRRNSALDSISTLPALFASRPWFDVDFWLT